MNHLSTPTRRAALMQLSKWSAATASASWLSACGGGSDAAPAPVAVPPATSAAPAPVPAPAPSSSPIPPTAAVLRTPASRFEGLSDFPYQENYATVSGLQMHYIDHGPANAQHVFLCLHGQPTWSYLYRKMIPIFANAGHRVIAPDWLGFGKSDKPRSDETYTFNFHRSSMLSFIEQLGLRNITLVVQDWGGLLGLTIPPAMPDRFARLLIMNTTFAIGEPLSATQGNWAVLSQQRRQRWLNTTDVNVPQIIQSASTSATPAVATAYDAPFPDPSYEAGARRFPVIVPISPTEEGAAVSREAMAWWGSAWQGKSFMAIGMRDNLLGPEVMFEMQKLIRNCPEPLEISAGGHFVQEDAGAQIATEALKHWG
jgi:haloalkane dehalogenase